MKTLILIALGLLPAFALRYGILRRRISHPATAATCFGIFIYVAIMVSSSVEKKFQQPADEPLLGPLPILTDLVSQMFRVAVPVVIASYLVLRRRSANDNDSD
jgi:hypothetical protein